VIGPEVIIGDDAILLHNVTIGHARQGPVVIGDRFFAGTGAIIIGPLHIGHGVTVGANTTVTFDVPDECTVVSEKARIIPSKAQRGPSTRLRTIPCA
jgi:serine O-acetyltransferase